jgi:hypothetical protein
MTSLPESTEPGNFKAEKHLKEAMLKIHRRPSVFLQSILTIWYILN